jgi:hypothetical protein
MGKRDHERINADREVKPAPNPAREADSLDQRKKAGAAGANSGRIEATEYRTGG